MEKDDDATFRYTPKCSSPRCGKPAVFKVAAPWSNGTSRELKNYGLACEAHRDSLFALAQGPPPGTGAGRGRDGRARRALPPRTGQRRPRPAPPARPRVTEPPVARSHSPKGPGSNPGPAAEHGRTAMTQANRHGRLRSLPAPLPRPPRPHARRSSRPQAPADPFARFDLPDDWEARFWADPRRAGPCRSSSRRRRPSSSPSRRASASAAARAATRARPTIRSPGRSSKPEVADLPPLRG